jgi:hypothetical protein
VSVGCLGELPAGALFRCLASNTTALLLLLQMVTAFGPKGLLSADKRVFYAGDSMN